MSWDDMYAKNYGIWNYLQIGPVYSDDLPSLAPLYDKEGFDLAWDAATRRVKERHAPSNCQCMTCQSRKITQSEMAKGDLKFKIEKLGVEVRYAQRQMKSYRLGNRLSRYLSYTCAILCSVMFITGFWIGGITLTGFAVFNHLEARRYRKRYYTHLDDWLTNSEDLANAKLELELLK